MGHDVGIFMTTYNMLQATQAAVESLFINTSHPFEFVIMDNNSTDGTKEWCEGEGIQYLADEKGNHLSAALNQAIHYFVDNFPDVKYISFVHNDMAFYKGWLQNLVEFFEETGKKGKISSENPRLKGYDKDDSDNIVQLMNNMERWTFRKGNECPSTFNVEIFKEAGIWFDENFKGIGGYEDWDFNRVISQHGFEVLILDNSMVWHDSMGTRQHLDQTEEGSHNATYHFQKWGDNKNWF